MSKISNCQLGIVLIVNLSVVLGKPHFIYNLDVEKLGMINT